MVKISVICIGRIKDGYTQDGILEFSKRLSKYANLNIVELAEEDENRGKELAVIKETERIANALEKRNQSFNILLDLRGKMKSSEEMSSEMEKILLTHSEISFIIGGSNGVHDTLREKVDMRLSFSPMTFPHQLMRLMLMEQIYRWVSISKNIKYHK